MIHIMLPSQYLGRALLHSATPDKRLMAAVLQTAIDDCRGSRSRRARGLRVPSSAHALGKARAYVASTDRSWAFSFECLCEALDLDPGSLRRELGIPVAGRTMQAVVPCPDPVRADGPIAGRLHG